MILFFVVLTSLCGSLVLQEFLPPIEALAGARILIMPVILFYGALAFPYPVVLLLAFVAGMMWDLINAHALDGVVEISAAWPIVLYSLLAALMHGFRPLFLKGRWEVHCLLSGVCTSAVVLFEYLLITYRRGGAIFPAEVWWRIGGAGLIAIFLAPIVFFAMHLVARGTGHQFRPTSMEVL